MPNDVTLAKPALREYRASKRQLHKEQRAHELQEREEHFLLQLRPAILQLFAMLIGRGELENIYIKRIWWWKPRLVIRMEDLEYGTMGRTMCVWVTSEGDVIIRKKFWLCMFSGGYPGVGMITPAPTGLSFIARTYKPRHLKLRDQQAILKEIKSRTPK